MGAKPRVNRQGMALREQGFSCVPMRVTWVRHRGSSAPMSIKNLSWVLDSVAPIRGLCGRAIRMPASSQVKVHIPGMTNKSPLKVIGERVVREVLCPTNFRWELGPGPGNPVLWGTNLMKGIGPMGHSAIALHSPCAFCVAPGDNCV